MSKTPSASRRRLTARRRGLPKSVQVLVTDDFWADLEEARRKTGIKSSSELIRFAVKRAGES